MGTNEREKGEDKRKERIRERRGVREKGSKGEGEVEEEWVRRREGREK